MLKFSLNRQLILDSFIKATPILKANVNMLLLILANNNSKTSPKKKKKTINGLDPPINPSTGNGNQRSPLTPPSLVICSSGFPHLEDRSPRVSTRNRPWHHLVVPLRHKGWSFTFPFLVKPNQYKVATHQHKCAHGYVPTTSEFFTLTCIHFEAFTTTWTTNLWFEFGLI